MITDPAKITEITWAEGCTSRTLSAQGNLSVKLETIAPAAGEQLHLHHQVQQVFYILKGEAEFVLNNTIHHLTTGNFINVAPGTIHQIRNSSQNDVTFLVISSPPVMNDRTTF